MTDAASPTSPPIYERRTRRLARAAALTLGLTVLLPRLWQDARGELHVLWPWERRPFGTEAWQESTVEWLWVGNGLSPGLALVLVLSLVAWRSAGLLPLARRGRWLLVPTAMGFILSAGSWSIAGRSPFPWVRDISWLVPAALGLVFVGMAGYQRLGRALSAIGGLLVFGTWLWPEGDDWEWPLLRAAFGPEITGLAGHLTQLLIVLPLIGGSLLVWTGLSGGTSRFFRRLTITGLVIVVALSLATSIWLPFAQVAPRDHVEGLARAWNVLRFSVRPYAEALLVAVGLFAWIVGAREEPAWHSVFD